MTTVVLSRATRPDTLATSSREHLRPVVTSVHTGHMNKTEAAAIVADNISAWCTRNDVDDSEITNTMVAEAISRMQYETVEGSIAHAAAMLRPHPRTVRTAYRRASGLID